MAAWSIPVHLIMSGPPRFANLVFLPFNRREGGNCAAPPGWWQPPELLAQLDEVGHPFPQHYHRGIYWSTDYVGNDRGVYHSKPLQPMHLPVLVDYGRGVRRRSHFAGARDVRISGGLP